MDSLINLKYKDFSEMPPQIRWRLHIETKDVFSHFDQLTGDDIGRLRLYIRLHNVLYYQKQSPIISDGEYDRLFARLQELEREYGDIDPMSPTQSIQVYLDRQFEKGRHSAPMLSLDNTYSTDDVRAFEERIRNILKTDESIAYVIEPKFDGLGMALTYESGRLVRALTRGNGVEGEDVTVNAFQIANIPHTIPYTGTIEVRGEVIMTHDAFARLNSIRAEAGEKLFANPRNAASGSLRQIDYHVTRDRDLQYYAYACPLLDAPETRRQLSEETGRRIESYTDYIGFLSYLGLRTSEGVLFAHAKDGTELLETILAYTNNKPQLGFDIDGLVIKVDSLSLWQWIGMTEHHPRYAIAYKFPSVQVRTRIRAVEHSVGRSGIVTPVALLEPVPVGGVTVERATLHNYDEAAAKDVRVGDFVFIVRAGEVIPEVIAPIAEVRDGTETPIIPPEACPSCGTPLARESWKVAYFCPNRTDCPAQIQGQLEVFVSRHGMDIEGLGEKNLEKFLELGYITDPVSIYHLSDHRDGILALDGYQTRSVDNLFAAIDQSRRTTLARMLYALGIPLTWRKTARLLASHISDRARTEQSSTTDPDILADILSSIHEEDLLAIPDIGPAGAVAVVEYLRVHASLVRSLLRELSITLEVPSVSAAGGATFCITGSFDGYSRDQIVEVLTGAGWIYRDSVSAKLQYLIAGSEAGSKLAKAQSLGVTVLSLDEAWERAGVER